MLTFGQICLCLPQLANNLLRCVLLATHQLAPFLRPDRYYTNITLGVVGGGNVREALSGGSLWRCMKWVETVCGSS